MMLPIIQAAMLLQLINNCKESHDVTWSTMPITAWRHLG